MAKGPTKKSKPAAGKSRAAKPPRAVAAAFPDLPKPAKAPKAAARPKRAGKGDRPVPTTQVVQDGLARQAAAKAASREAARRFAIEAARTLSDDHCEDVVVLELNDLSPLSDFIVIASGTSDRQMRGSADDVEKVGAKMGYSALRRSVDERTTWLLVDFADVVVHVFEPNTRAFYDLEMLWGDAPRVAWERSGA
jgi:ribosome-associated protein